MPSTFFGLNIAVSGMSTYNAGLTTTGHNISNVKTTGYSRQIVKQSAKDAVSLRTSYGMLGSGVVATEVVSSRSDYYDAKYWICHSDLGKYDIQSFYLSSIEDYIYPEDESSGSITNSLDKFFSSLKYLTTSSMDKTIRAEVAGFADTLTYYVRDVGIKLQRLQADVNTEIEATIDQINAYAEQIASLTQQINTLEVYGDRANDLRDQRAVILDNLSALADITVTEKAPADGNGVNQFIVDLGGGVLVDTTRFNTINIVGRTNKINQNDAVNLYDLEWSFGQTFNCHSTILGGKLQGLFETRDGNNAENFKATLTDVQTTGDVTKLTLTSDAYSSVNASNLAKLDLPVKDGVLTIGNVDFAYESFSATVAADGTYTYTFTLKDKQGQATLDRLNNIKNGNDKELKQAMAGDSIAFRGIPYYMSQLDEFIRTFSANFNTLQNQGYDLYGNLGKDLFLATSITSGVEHNMTEFLYNKTDDFYYLDGIKVFDSNKRTTYQKDGYSFAPVTGEPDYYNLIDKDGNFVEKIFWPKDDKNIFSFNSADADGTTTSYYTMNILNFRANKEIVSDGGLLACSAENTEGLPGWEEAKNLDKMLALQSDNSMFKQGDPGSFMNVLCTAVLGVDSDRVTAAAENAENILNAVDHRRTSIIGVDEDEEGRNLIEYQNLLHYQYRVLSIMNEVLDKLINGTAV